MGDEDTLEEARAKLEARISAEVPEAAELLRAYADVAPTFESAEAYLAAVHADPVFTVSAGTGNLE